MRDEKVAQAMELKYGLCLSWKAVGEIMRMDHDYLRARVSFSARRGMKNKNPLGPKARQQRVRIVRMRGGEK